MKLTRVCLVSLGCMGGAFAFGVVANAAIDLVMPAPGRATVARLAAATPAPVEAPAPAANFALASATSSPADIGPVKVKTIPIMLREELAGESAEQPVAAPRQAAVPLPRRRPADAPESTASIARQPGALAIAAATRKVQPDDGDPLGAAGIERMKTALALTAEQEEYWPAIAVELRAIGKSLHKGGAKGQISSFNVDDETLQRLYWAAAPLISRLSYEQKAKAKQMARLMGLTKVAEAL